MKKSKWAIKEPEEGYQELLDNLNDGIVTTDLAGDITYFNKRFAGMLGYSAKELAGKKFIEFVHPEDRKRVLERYKKRQRGKDIPSIYDIKGLKKSGEVIYVEINASAIREGKKIVGVRGILRDITEYKEAEEAQRHLMDNIPDVIMIVDSSGKIHYINHPAAGLKAEEVVGSKLYDFIPPGQKNRMRGYLKHVIKTGEILDYEMLGPGPKGTTAWYESRLIPLKKEGQIKNAILITKDITERKEAEEELKKTKDNLQSILDYSPFIVFMRDTEGRYLLMNKQAERAYGMKIDDVVGKTNYDLFPKEMADRTHKEDQKIIKTRKTYSVEETVNIKGRDRIFLTTKFPILDSAGKAIAVCAVADDITEREQAREVLRESEEKYRDLYDNAPDMYHSIDENGIIIDCNETEAGMLGYKKEEIVGRPIIDFFTEASKRLFEKQFTKLKKEGVQLNLEREFVRKDGTTFPASLNVFAEFDEAGKLVRTKTIARDITERKKAREVLRESEEKYRALVENAFDGINIVDGEGNLVFVNPEYSKMLGYGPEELVGESFLITLLPRDREAGMKLFKEAINKPIEPYTYEGKNMRKDGSIIDVQSKWNYVYRDGKIVGTMAIARDITERKQAEAEITKYTRELEETGRMKDLFTDIMRHDILNPVMIIAGMAELGLYDSPEDEELGTILRSTHRIQGIIDDAATLSTLKDVAGLEKKELDLKEIIDGVCEDLTHVLQAAGMELENRATERMPIKANQILKDVFLNLLSNTVKYASEGKKVVIEAVDEGESYVVAVKDYGPGIPDEDKEDIFERFMRVKKAGVKGTGLGLAIVKKLMELHKGIVWVEDSPEGGSIFYVKIPKSEA